jgi:hypothetical protein
MSRKKGMMCDHPFYAREPMPYFFAMAGSKVQNGSAAR